MKIAALLAVLVPVLVALVGSCAATDGAPHAAPGDSAAEGRLTGAEWRLVDVGGKPVVAGLGDRVASLRFDVEASSLHGSSGLNTFFAPYALDGGALRVETLALTRMAGPPELMEQERAFTAAIQAARSFRIERDTLLLCDAQGAVLARLRTSAP